MPRQGAAPGCCTTARLYRRDPAAPCSDVCQEEAGRETSFLFYSNCHPTPVTAAAKCFQLPREMAQSDLPPSPPPCHRDEPWWAPALLPSLRPSRGAGAPAVLSPPWPPRLPAASPPARCPGRGGAAASRARSSPARCPLPGAQHCVPEQPELGLSSRQARDPLPGTDGLFSSRAEIHSLALCFLPSAQVYFPCFLFMSWVSIEFPKVIAIPCHRSRTQRLPRCQDPSFAIGPVPFPCNHCGNSLCFASGSCSSGPNQGPLSKAWVF